MPYDPMFVQPMREELTRVGFEELRRPEDVDRAVAQPGRMLLFVNSICGCAAGVARPGVARSLQAPAAPKRLTTVFAGQDVEATARARSYFGGMPPSSPQVAILEDGKLLFLLQRHEIEGRTADQVAAALESAYRSF
ncbi:MAG TPA: BrxA/BrxB family bacilliredoxin [Thermoanaerobaculia bacterium]|jgi:bacilliredoxin|nr:BrxA/BrxB family bacilliredoxin [Thermoanaerobaculia bacterium]